MDKQYISSWLRLLRIPNLAIMAITQYLIRYTIIRPVLYASGDALATSGFDFLLLVLTTLLIAAAGYIINDLVDVKIDTINRPEKVVIGTIISPLTVQTVYITLNVIGCIFGFFIAYKVRSVSFGLLFPFIVFMLWFYATHYKRMLLSGNLVIAFLSAFVLLIVWLFEFFMIRQHPLVFADVMKYILPAFWYVGAYALFAFVVTLVREIIKDMEDREGDAKGGCRSLPIVLGDKKAARIAAVLSWFTILLIAWMQYLLWKQGSTLVVWYAIAVLQIPLAFLAVKVLKASTRADLHYLSTFAKVIMLAGILSMQVLFISF